MGCGHSASPPSHKARGGVSPSSTNIIVVLDSLTGSYEQPPVLHNPLLQFPPGANTESCSAPLAATLVPAAPPARVCWETTTVRHHRDDGTCYVEDYKEGSDCVRKLSSSFDLISHDDAPDTAPPPVAVEDEEKLHQHRPDSILEYIRKPSPSFGLSVLSMDDVDDEHNAEDGEDENYLQPRHSILDDIMNAATSISTLSSCFLGMPYEMSTEQHPAPSLSGEGEQMNHYRYVCTPIRKGPRKTTIVGGGSASNDEDTSDVSDDDEQQEDEMLWFFPAFTQAPQQTLSVRLQPNHLCQKQREMRKSLLSSITS